MFGRAAGDVSGSNKISLPALPLPPLSAYSEIREEGGKKKDRERAFVDLLLYYKVYTHIYIFRERERTERGK